MISKINEYDPQYSNHYLQNPAKKELIPAVEKSDYCINEFSRKKKELRRKLERKVNPDLGNIIDLFA